MSKRVVKFLHRETKLSLPAQLLMCGVICLLLPSVARFMLDAGFRTGSLIFALLVHFDSMMYVLGGLLLAASLSEFRRAR
jgi:hypothetical protein